MWAKMKKNKNGMVGMNDMGMMQGGMANDEKMKDDKMRQRHEEQRQDEGEASVRLPIDRDSRPRHAYSIGEEG
jgi:hypothetical protein